MKLYTYCTQCTVYKRTSHSSKDFRCHTSGLEYKGTADGGIHIANQRRRGRRRTKAEAILELASRGFQAPCYTTFLALVEGVAGSTFRRCTKSITHVSVEVELQKQMSCLGRRRGVVRTTAVLPSRLIAMVFDTYRFTTTSRCKFNLLNVHWPKEPDAWPKYNM